MFDDLVMNLRENHDKYFARDMEAANAIEELCGLCASQSKDCSEAIAKYLELWAKQPNWIPVEEWLPKADEYDARGYSLPYLVMNGWMRVTARRTKDYWVLFGNGTVLEYVTHWMPLPKPPKGES